MVKEEYIQPHITNTKPVQVVEILKVPDGKVQTVDAHTEDAVLPN